MSAMKFREPNEVLWRGVRPGHRGEQIAKYDSANNSTVIIHTVSAGKTFFMTTANYMSETSGAGAGGRLDVLNASGVLQYTIAVIVFTAVGQGAISMSFNPPLEIPGGYKIVVFSNSAALTARAFIHGWEE